MKNVLITGGLGFIGSNLSNKLLSLGYNVTIVDNMSSSRPDASDFIKNRPEITAITSCFSDEVVLDEIKKGKFDTVFHVAAIPRVSYSVENPFETTDNNVNIVSTTKFGPSLIQNV